MTAIRGGKIPNGYRFEYDLMQDVRDRLNRKIEIDGEKALEIALAEVGYVKERTCQMDMVGRSDCICSECGALTHWVHVSKPNYCHNCGAKVVE